jgi:hypothetical protein
MTRKLKVLGTALIAAFAISAAFASMASADELTSEISPVTITGAGETGAGINKLSFPGVGTSECTSSTFTATTTTPTTSVTVFPSYSGCTSLGFPSTIHMNGCHYVLKIVAGSGGTFANADIVCPAGKEITITANPAGTRKCVLHIPPQTNRSRIDITNVGTETTRELVFHLELGGLTISSTSGAALGPDGLPLGSGLGACPAITSNAGALTGTVKVTGEEDKAIGALHKGIFVS